MSVCIWYVSKYATPPSCGTSSGRGYLLMKELVKMGNRVVLVTSDSNLLASPPELESDYLLEIVDNIELCWVRTVKYSVAKSHRRVLSWLHFEWRLLWLPLRCFPKPNVVVVSSLSLLTILNGLYWRFRYGCRLIFEVRDIWPLTLTEEGGFKSYNPFVLFLSVLEYIGYKYSDAIVGTMPNLSEHVIDVLGYSKLTYCVPMGVDESLLYAPKALPHSYEEIYIPADKFIVAYVGSIGISNALDIFFQCADHMRLNSRIHFLIVGDGDLKGTYQHDYGHFTNLTFAPRVEKSMVQSVLSKCDLLFLSVYHSRVWKYGQSLNKVIDYMIAGKPIVASYTGFESMINEANCGSYVLAGDIIGMKQEIERYAGMTEQERLAIGARGRSWLLENRRYHKLAENYLRIMLGNNSEALVPETLR